MKAGTKALRPRKLKPVKLTEKSKSCKPLLLDQDRQSLTMEAPGPARRASPYLRAPNIEELARRGGGDPNVAAHQIGMVDNELVVTAYGNSTATTVLAVVHGFEKYVEPARQFCVSEPKPTPELVATTFPNIAFAGPAWIQRNIIDRCGATNHREMALDLDKIIRKRYPNIGRALQDYPVEPSQLDESVPARPAEAKHSAIMAEIARINVVRGKDWKSKRRALLVAQVLEELQMIREADDLLRDPELPTDYGTVKLRFKEHNFYLFPAVAGSENLIRRILGANKRQIGLAQKIVAQGERRDMTTVAKDWNKYKPEEYRDRAS